MWLQNLLLPMVAASATYGCRHDLKIYSSDEGRVQMTAAAFARGFLDLEGFLTPILASLVSKNKAATDMLDVTSDAGRQANPNPNPNPNP